MLLHEPIIITPRLLPGIKIGNGTISIDYGTVTQDRRQSYQWYLDLDNGESYYGDDLASGVGGGTLQEGLASLLAFMYSASEQEELFEPDVTAWCCDNSDDLSIAAAEVEENPYLIKE
jgi:hypothetical protein